MLCPPTARRSGACSLLVANLDLSRMLGIMYHITQPAHSAEHVERTSWLMLGNDGHE